MIAGSVKPAVPNDTSGKLRFPRVLFSYFSLSCRGPQKCWHSWGDYGTGSNPPGLNGLQRSIRQKPITPPLMTPYLSMAS